jgi:hypothetical protein
MNDDGSYHGLSLSMMLSNNNIRCPKSAQKRLYKGSLGWCGRIVLCIPTALLAYMLYPATSLWPTSVPPFTLSGVGGGYMCAPITPMPTHPPVCGPYPHVPPSSAPIAGAAWADPHEGHGPAPARNPNMWQCLVGHVLTIHIKPRIHHADIVCYMQGNLLCEGDSCVDMLISFD